MIPYLIGVMIGILVWQIVCMMVCEVYGADSIKFSFVAMLVPMIIGLILTRGRNTFNTYDDEF